MTKRGAEFGEILPFNTSGQLDLSFQTIPVTALGLDAGQIFQVTPSNSFRLGQQLILWLGVANPVFGTPQDQNWISTLRLKPWWARPNREYRQPGYPAFIGIDTQVFGAGPNAGLLDNRYVWMPSDKRLEVTQYQQAPPTPAPARYGKTVFEEDLWEIELQDPTDATYAGKFVAPQQPSRWVPFFYPAWGYALGFTYEFDVGSVDSEITPDVLVSLSWTVGTLGGGGGEE
jgi:hypothetical protein